jgi:hypothetical protein
VAGLDGPAALIARTSNAYVAVVVKPVNEQVFVAFASTVQAVGTFAPAVVETGVTE